MRCPTCNGRTKVYDTEQRPEGRVRRRLCVSAACARKFRTIETLARLVTGYVSQSDDEA